MSRFTSPTALADRLAHLERRDVEPLDVPPVPRPADCGEWFTEIDTILIRQAHELRGHYDVAEVAENLASLKANGGSLFLIEINTAILDALRSSDPRRYLANQWHGAVGCSITKVRLFHWMKAHQAFRMAEAA